MRIDSLLPRQSQCISCPEPTPCNCASNQECFQINRSCNQCSQTKCVDRNASSSSSSGVSKGALAGGIIGALVLVAVVIAIFLWYRRRQRLAKAKPVALPEIKEMPAPAETVLNRPDPAEKPPGPAHVNNVRVYAMSSNTTINLDPAAQESASRAANGAFVSPPSNPFEDNHSIQTAGTGGTNVIPIAFVAPESISLRPSQDSSSTSSSQPTRPVRSPDLNINLDHVQVSTDSFRTRTEDRTTPSGVSRNSYMSGASYSSDFLNEAAIIVTPSRTAVRQVLGVVKAEVINASSSTDSLKLPSSSRLANKSPLASSSFGPDDIVTETDEGQDPFDDKQSNRAHSTSPAASSSFLHPYSHSDRNSASSEWTPEQPKLPWKGSHQPSDSVSTQGGSIIDIGNATRVNLSAASSPGLPRSPYRTTMARLVNPASLQEQQRRALAQAQVQAPASNASRRTSGSSVVSAASRAYSILESFPFVPPSPISDRPIRSPPRSPQTQQSFSNASSPLSQQTFNVTPPSPHAQSDIGSHTSTERTIDDPRLPSPPNRKTLALSTISTASSGLGSFPFQIETSSTTDFNSVPPVPVMGRQRASLDTLAITSDLASYPLAFDRDNAPSLPKKH
ncbi:hypothetical protein F5887DRAFT_1278417 [Amanita rubescens]|nr:hypothetical protein F5887DRAFT_1278417 [Amanita rubescens]